MLPRAVRTRSTVSDQQAVRLQKFLARAGVASRRASEQLILDGRVRVNDTLVRELGTRVDPEKDRVSVDGRDVGLPALRWVLFHKPAGTLTTRSDPHGGRTVYDVLPEEDQGLTYVGRLDRDTEGLLMLTNDGDLAHLLLHPSTQVEREYEAWVVGMPTRETLAALTRGVMLEDGPARARKAAVLSSEGAGALVQLVLTDGRKREARRMLEAVGHPVRGLKRVRFGPIRLGRLSTGKRRSLTKAEIKEIQKCVGV